MKEGDKVQLDGKDVGKRLERSNVAQVLAYHKPRVNPSSTLAAHSRRR